MAKRVFLIVLDSVGAGEAPDAAAFGDQGCDTLGTCMRSGRLNVPVMESLGLRHLQGTSFQHPEGKPIGCYGKMQEKSAGKDTTVGHWEIAGLISERPLPTYPEGFPEEIIREFEKRTGRGVLCNRPYSGTEVIRDYGREQVSTGKLIVYTSADSVFQIAAHEDVVPVEELYRCCRIARELLTGEHGVGRERWVKPRETHVGLENGSQGIGTHAPASGGEEESAIWALCLLPLGGGGQPGARLVEIAPHPVERHLIEGNDPLLRALAKERNLAPAKVHRPNVEARNLGDAGTGGVEQLQERSVPHTRGIVRVAGGKELPYVLVGHGLGEASGPFGRGERGRGVHRADSLSEHPPIEVANGRETPVNRAHRVACAIEVGEKTAQVSVGRMEGVHARALCPRGKGRQIRPICFHGVIGEASNLSKVREEGSALARQNA